MCASSSPSRGRESDSYPSPLMAGLSHVSKELEEEYCVESGAFHFSARRGVVGMSPENIEGKASNHGEVLWGVVLPGAGVVLVEDYVQGPMELIFHRPVGADHFEHLGGRQASG